MYTISFISSKAKQNGWSSVYGFRPDTQAELLEKGELNMVIALSSPLDFKFEHLGKLIFDEVEQSYFSAEFTKPLEQIEMAVDMMSKRLDKILEREPELAKAGLDMQCAITVILDDICYVGVIGEAKADLVRKGRVVEIDRSLQDPSGRGFLRIGSFKLNPELDTFFILTQSAYQALPPEQLIQLSTSLDLSELADDDHQSFTVAMITDEQRVQAVAEQRAAAEAAEKAAAAKRKQVADEAAAKAAAEEEIALQAQDEQDQLEEQQEQEQAKTKDNMIDIDAQLEEDNLLAEVDAADDGREQDVAAKTPALAVAKASPVKSAAAKIDKQKITATLQNVRAGVSKHTSTIAAAIKQRKIGDRIKSLQTDISKKITKLENPRGGKTYQIIISRIIRGIRNFQNNVVNFVRKEILGIDQGRAMYLKGRKSPRNYRLIGVIVVVVIVLMGFVVSNAIDNRNQQVLREQITKSLSDKQKQVDQITADVQTLVSGVSNEQAKLSKITDVNNAVASVASVDVTKLRDSKDFQTSKTNMISTLNSQIDKLRGVVVVNPILIADLGTNFKNVKTTDIVFNKGYVYVSDRSNNVIYKIPATANATPVRFVDHSLNTPDSLAIDANGNLIVVDEDPNSSIGTVNLNDGSIQKHPNLNIDNVGIADNIKAIRIGKDDRVYWVDTQNGAVKWVTRTNTGGYDKTINTRITDNDFTNAVDLDVDSKIYVLSSDKGLLRYANGQPNHPQLGGMLSDDNLINTNAMEVSSSHIYIADAKKQRVVILTKARNGDAGFVDFVAQLVYRGSDDKFKNIVDVVFDENEKALYVLDGLKIYKLELKTYNIKGYEN